MNRLLSTKQSCRPFFALDISQDPATWPVLTQSELAAAFKSVAGATRQIHNMSLEVYGGRNGWVPNDGNERARTRSLERAACAALSPRSSVSQEVLQEIVRTQ